MTGHWRDFVEVEGPIGRFLDWGQVEQSAGLSRTTAWRLRRRGDFPDPYVLSQRRVGYRETEIEAWKRWRAGHRVRAAKSVRTKGQPAPACAPEPPPPSAPCPAAAPTQPPRPPRALASPSSSKPQRRPRSSAPQIQQLGFDF